MDLKVPVALTIAGSDSGGGAGIQADLKTFAFHRVHGTSAITCITAQNTQGVTEVMAINPDMVKAQIEAVVTDMELKAIKIGMLFNQEIMTAVADSIKSLQLNPIVVDPVMVSRTGAQLIDNQAVDCLKKLLIPQALVTTPNIYEAELLTGEKISNLAEIKRAAEKISNLGVQNVLIKGGGNKAENKAVDVFFDGKTHQLLQTQVIKTQNTHGTGCTLSAGITANLALGKPLFTAIASAKEYVTTALEYSLTIGSGCGPVGHFFPLLDNF